jgi:thymidylate synthase (FAD)
MERRDLKEYAASRDWRDRTETPLLRDVAFNRHSMNDGHHVSPSDNGELQVGDDRIIVNLVQGLNPNFEKVMSKATRATIGIDLNEPDRDDRDWEEMLKGGLQTALESQVVVFEVSGVSRACTHQIVRSRRAAFHQQSMRASFYGRQPEFRIPESVWNGSEQLREFWTSTIMMVHKAYEMACDEDISYQDARYVLPEGTTNYILCEYSLREFMNVYAYRGCSLFQWEITSVMRAMRDILVARYDYLEPYIKISCEKTHGPEEYGGHKCTFQGWENVEGQCDFPWAREDNRVFRSERHRIERKD